MSFEIFISRNSICSAKLKIQQRWKPQIKIGFLQKGGSRRIIKKRKQIRFWQLHDIKRHRIKICCKAGNAVELNSAFIAVNRNVAHLMWQTEN